MIKLIKVNSDGVIMFTDKELKDLLKEVYENGRQDGMMGANQNGIDIKEYAKMSSKPGITWATTTTPYYSNINTIMTSSLNIGETEPPKEINNGTSKI